MIVDQCYCMEDIPKFFKNKHWIKFEWCYSPFQLQNSLCNPSKDLEIHVFMIFILISMKVIKFHFLQELLSHSFFQNLFNKKTDQIIWLIFLYKQTTYRNSNQVVKNSKICLLIIFWLIKTHKNSQNFQKKSGLCF